MSFLSGLSPIANYRQLRSKGSASTFDRLLLSRHVTDLRLIFVCTLWLAAILIIATVIEGWKDGGFTIAGGIVAAAGAIVAWCYQTGSARLGVVDLFACEIATICRVCTVVGLTERTITTFDQIKADTGPDIPQPGTPLFDTTNPDGINLNFQSQESYEPVFDNNTRDLQVLDASVVINVTQFYTYLKAMRDTWRKAGKSSTREQRLAALRDVLYMQFLAFESGRAAVAELIEYEPNEADCTMIILFSEIPALAFLLDKFPVNDLRHRRLALRVAAYQGIITALPRPRHRRRRRSMGETQSDRGRSESHL